MSCTIIGRLPMVLVLACILTACGNGSGNSANAALEAAPPPVAGFTVISDARWDNTAVRDVLQTFAYGGQATDRQIQVWADMSPAVAIREMLTFEEHNFKLSPPDPAELGPAENRPGTLRALSDFWSSNDPANHVQVAFRPLYSFPGPVWYRATLSRGLNPFRQRIGLWETNYHLAINNRVGVSSDQTIRYYDEIMTALAAGKPYQDVLAIAAVSAAIARQYGHYQNRWIDGRCQCNEDFAREYQQLFFGILGNYDPAYHETVTIKNTAAALTDMRLDFDPEHMDFVDSIVFGQTFHAPGSLDILQASIGGSDARERIHELSQIAIEHPESLDRLPVMIVAGLADENLDAEKIEVIRRAWRGMPTKRLLDFLQGYAISEVFHSKTRVRRQTSVDRLFTASTQIALSNREVDLEIYIPYDLADENVQVFSPRHNVFGAQTGLEAADSTHVFRKNYNRLTQAYWRYALPFGEPLGASWEKNWAQVVPTTAAGTWQVQEVAEWLWQRFVADGLVNFGDLERAHVYALLGSGFDLTTLIGRRELQAAGENLDDPDLYNFDRVVTTAELATDPHLGDLQAEMAAKMLALDDPDLTIRREANLRIGQAINFIVGTPYVFAQEGR